jgi:medium-chain acyl-[acyl-carrier-protein] hydrolase
MGKKFFNDIEVANYQADRSNHLSIPMIPRLVIATSTFQSIDLDASMEKMHQKGIGWVILQYDIHVNSLPQFGDKIRVETNPRTQNEYFATRDFNIYDENGQVLIWVESLWSMMDMSKRKIIKLDPDFALPFEPEIVARVPKLQSPEKFTEGDFQSRSHHVNYFEIDTNQHVNNAVYFDWFLMSTDFEFLKTHQLSRMLVKYQREVEPESDIQSETQVVSGTELLHRITIDGEIKATAQTWWKEVN